MQKIVATIEARMSSSRLRGKVLMEAAGRPMLSHLIRRLRQVKSIHEIIVATTTNPADDALVSFAQHEGVKVFRGSEEDVMGRVIGAAEAVGGEIIVEITGDCPVIDPDIVEQVIRLFQLNDCDYASNTDTSFCGFPAGMDCQVFSLETLKKSASMTMDPQDREHVSLHLRNNPQLFRHVRLPAPNDIQRPQLEVMLDTPSDYARLKKLIEHFEPGLPLFSCRDVVAYFDDQR